jgi:uncharacterized short protein YbdD (DUF466 family)
VQDIKSPYQVLKEFEQHFINAIQKSIDENDRHARGGLWQSVKAQTKIYGQSVVMEVSMADYWKYVENGRRKGAKAPPQDAMLNFIRDRGIKVELSALRKKKISGVKSKKIKKAYKQMSVQQKAKSLAFVLGQSIKRKGIKPTHFLAEALDGGVVEDFKKELFSALGREIQIEIKNVSSD